MKALNSILQARMKMRPCAGPSTALEPTSNVVTISGAYWRANSATEGKTAPMGVTKVRWNLHPAKWTTAPPKVIKDLHQWRKKRTEVGLHYRLKDHLAWALRSTQSGWLIRSRGRDAAPESVSRGSSSATAAATAATRSASTRTASSAARGSAPRDSSSAAPPASACPSAKFATASTTAVVQGLF